MGEMEREVGAFYVLIFSSEFGGLSDLNDTFTEITITYRHLR